MSGSLSERGLIVVTALVWITLAVVGIFAVAYTGINGLVFMFVVYIVAVASWSRVVKESRPGGDLERQLSELANKISELSAKIDELRKVIEE
ncbi:MAG: hypothetical protein ACP5KY_09975 [Thermoproteus sp.]